MLKERLVPLRIRVLPVLLEKKERLVQLEPKEVQELLEKQDRPVMSVHLVQEVIWGIRVEREILVIRVQKVIRERWVIPVLLDIRGPMEKHPILAQLDLEDLLVIRDPKVRLESHLILELLEPLDPKERQEPQDQQDQPETKERQEPQELKEVLEPQEPKERQGPPELLLILVRLEQLDSQVGQVQQEPKVKQVLHLIQVQQVPMEKLDLRGLLVLMEKQVELVLLVQEV